MTSCFPKNRRLLTQSDFSHVFRRADAKAGSGEFFLLARASKHNGYSRLGFVLSGKKVKRAVDRNRIKRIAREEFRVLPAGTYPDIDIVFMANRGAEQLDRTTLHQTIRSLLNKIGRRYERLGVHE